MRHRELQVQSSLLDEALALDTPAREARLTGLEGDAAPLVPALHRLLARDGGRRAGESLRRGPSFAAPADPAAGFEARRSICPYRLLRELGACGMGEVWLAERRDGALKRQEALLLPMLAGRRSLIEQRFARERDILAGLGLSVDSLAVPSLLHAKKFSARQQRRRPGSGARAGPWWCPSPCARSQ